MFNIYELLFAVQDDSPTGRGDNHRDVRDHNPSLSTFEILSHLSAPHHCAAMVLVQCYGLTMLSSSVSANKHVHRPHT